MSLHVYTVNHQSATRFTVHAGEFTHRFTYPKRATAFANCCCRMRWMQYLTVQVYYDVQYYWCRKGHGCKAAAK